jgi:hypothetical protein
MEFFPEGVIDLARKRKRLVEIVPAYRLRRLEYRAGDFIVIVRDEFPVTFSNG